jgi:hypothetical protein
MASPGPTLRRHWGVRLAASLGAVLFAVTVSGVLYRIVSAEYLRDPVTGWYAWASGTVFVFFGTLIFLDREQRANGLLLVVFGILGQLPSSGMFTGGLLPSVPVWAIFFITLTVPVSSIVLAVVLLRFPERRLQKCYERRFIAVMAIWLVSFGAIYAVTWPCWATPTKVTAWPWWLANCDLSELAGLAIYWGQIVGAAGLVLLLTLRILRTRGFDRRVYVPVHIASIVGMGVVVFLLVETVRGLVGSDWVRILHSLLAAQAVPTVYDVTVSTLGNLNWSR